ncbi:MAG: Smr/MutS family protein [Deltaproteobacteria bacterium]|jgi:DNA-nicking Smr family endonuclease|nr:Smr/MutS family protein [Deltaproteobacteria bacterium]
MSKSKKSISYYDSVGNDFDDSEGRKKRGKENPKKPVSKAKEAEPFALEDSPFAALADLRAKLKAQQYEESLKQQEELRAAKKMSKAMAQTKTQEPEPKPEPRPDEFDDQRYFLEAMEGVVPISGKKLVTPKPLPADSWSLPSQQDEDNAVVQDLIDLINGKIDFDFSATDELLEARASDLAPSVMEQLKKGLIPVQDHLDVHGYSLPQAEDAINTFIMRSVYYGRKCVLLVHGRGHRSPDGIPIIKRNLEHLLLRGPVKKHILAFTTAKPIDGGSGASYILLRG